MIRTFLVVLLLTACGGSSSPSATPANTASGGGSAKPAEFEPYKGASLEEVCSDLCARIATCEATGIVPADAKCETVCPDYIHDEQRAQGGPWPCAVDATNCDGLRACANAPTKDVDMP